jgi:hypothetical protein
MTSFAADDPCNSLKPSASTFLLFWVRSERVQFARGSTCFKSCPCFPYTAAARSGGFRIITRHGSASGRQGSGPQPDQGPGSNTRRWWRAREVCSSAGEAGACNQMTHVPYVAGVARWKGQWTAASCWIKAAAASQQRAGLLHNLCLSPGRCMLTLQVPLWDELWWHDGLLHSQPVLDGTLEPQLATPVSSSSGRLASHHSIRCIACPAACRVA